MGPTDDGFKLMDINLPHDMSWLNVTLTGIIFKIRLNHIIGLDQWERSDVLQVFITRSGPTLWIAWLESLSCLWEANVVVGAVNPSTWWCLLDWWIGFFMCYFGHVRPTLNLPICISNQETSVRNSCVPFCRNVLDIFVNNSHMLLNWQNWCGLSFDILLVPSLGNCLLCWSRNVDSIFIKN